MNEAKGEFILLLNGGYSIEIQAYESLQEKVSSIFHSSEIFSTVNSLTERNALFVDRMQETKELLLISIVKPIFYFSRKRNAAISGMESITVFQNYS